jgi:hypothetical protein
LRVSTQPGKTVGSGSFPFAVAHVLILGRGRGEGRAAVAYVRDVLEGVQTDHQEHLRV